jgi:A/G-specific adenine glycosylase
MLHAAAKVVACERGGKFPESAQDWRALPGIGRYTAAAIASIALKEPVAVVDGNVERVLQRLAGKPISGEQVWNLAESLLDRNRPGDFNQAMMELGATVCTPRSPSCLMCPVLELCATRGELPGLGKPPRQNKRDIHYALTRRNGSIFLTQRRDDARLMAGMWELPEIVDPGHHSQPLLRVKHSITVTDYTVNVWDRPEGADAAGNWCPLDRLPKLPLTGLARKILRRSGIIPASMAKIKSSRMAGKASVKTRFPKGRER